MRLNAIHAAIAATVLAFTCGAQVRAAEQEPIQPLEAPKITNPAKVELGKQLFFDPRLSRSGWISCNSCHNLSMGGSDNFKSSVGDHWAQGSIRAPTVLNSSLNIAQFWDGRAKDLADQAGGPIANPIEMGSTHEAAEKMLNTIPGYRAEFKKIYGTDKITIKEITDAIAAFEATLITPNSPFDKWLKGDQKAITAYQLSGYQLFKDTGCTACHNGPAVGGNSYQKFGLVHAVKTDNPAVGRADVTGNDSDHMMFKVPTLRNVELTPPYFHDGSASTLNQAVDKMAWVQLGKKLTVDQTDRIVAFLKTLTGDQPNFPLPQLPPSSDATPRPDPFAPGPSAKK
ncbi:MAG: cytochrome-c peroxidase [Burkholderiaceae bacterium]|jgi:cytochrome c peroxidase|nr:cytochrome-c peroxidase [Burkholderiaceae bacterium]